MQTIPLQIDADTAKEKLDELLEHVRHGLSFTITQHGRPVAQLVSYTDDIAEKRKIATATLRSLRKRHTLGGKARPLREAGRA